MESGRVLADVTHAVQALQSAVAIEDVQKIAHDAFGRYGFDGYLCMAAPADPEKQTPFILYSGWPSAWLNHYMKMGYRRHDPMLRHLTQTNEPFLCKDTPVDVNDIIGQKILRERIAYGLEFELAIPVQVEDKLTGGVFLTGPEQAALTANRHELQLIAMALFSIAHQFSKDGINPLTPRETEMLEWAAKGKTTAQIAEILGVTPRTVNTHFENAQRKLDARNRLQTVAIAIRLKLIR